MIFHPAKKYLVPAIETARIRLAAVMPLPGAENVVACRLKTLTEHGVVLRYLLTHIVEVKQDASGVQHRAARHANRRACAARYVRMSECRPVRDQHVQIWGVNLLVAERADRVEPLVIGEEKENIWFHEARDR